MKNDVNYLKDESYQMMGACFEVYNEQGFGLSEDIYQESLEIEFEIQSIPFVSKAELLCYYKERLLRKKFVPDLVVHERIIVELKAISEMTEEHEGQLLNYMRISKSPLGYLVNFGKRGGLDFRRFVMSEFIPE